VLINGGAAIAILTFLGNVWAKDPITHKAAGALAWPLELFLIGVGLGAVTAALAYVSQSCFGRRWNKASTYFQGLAVAATAAEIAAFIWGLLSAAAIFQQSFG
jgi:hypothetical protein